MKNAPSRKPTESVKTKAYARTRPAFSAQPDYFLYEVLKKRYTATATTSAEYDAAVNRAAREAGI